MCKLLSKSSKPHLSCVTVAQFCYDISFVVLPINIYSFSQLLKYLFTRFHVDNKNNISGTVRGRRQEQPAVR